MKVLIFGASGTAGGGVLDACLASPAVESVRAIVRQTLPLEHPKLEQILHADYQDYSGVARVFADIDICLFCLGISATQVSGEAEYRRITRDFALAAATALHVSSPAAVLHFISGQGTRPDSRMMWARVKGETERELIERFNAVCWRPAAIDGVPSAGTARVHRYLRLLMPVVRPFRGLYVRGEDLGRAMLQATAEGMRGRIIENREIRDIADRARS